MYENHLPFKDRRMASHRGNRRVCRTVPATHIHLILVGCLCAVLYLPLIFISFSWGALIILLVLTYFICDILLNIRYTIDGTSLQIRCSLFKSTCDIRQIKEISRTRTIESAPAASLDRIRIRFKKGGDIILSPMHKEEFIRHLMGINPDIRVKDIELPDVNPK